MSFEQDNKVNDYSEKSIRILKGLQPVKQRPGMYTLTDCPLHIIQEVIDNATDEVLANFANRIILTEHADGSISVEDNGRGISTEDVERIFGKRKKDILRERKEAEQKALAERKAASGDAEEAAGKKEVAPAESRKDEEKISGTAASAVSDGKSSAETPEV